MIRWKKSIPPHNFFSLSGEKVLIKGAKYSNIIDFKNRKIHRLNAHATRILELGNQGYKTSEIAGKLSSKIQKSDIMHILNELAGQNIIEFSSRHMPRLTKEYPSPKLNFLWIELTHRCNLRCIHCYAEAKNRTIKRSQDLPKENVQKIIDEAVELGCRRIQFTGGEPTLSKYFKEVIVYAKERGFEFIEIFTNGTTLNEPVISFLAKNGVNVAISIYSYRAETHDSITGVVGSFERTMNNLKLLLDYGVKTCCEVVAMKENEEDLAATIYLLSKLGLCERLPDPVRPIGKGRGMKNWPSNYGLKYIESRPFLIIEKESYVIKQRWNSCWFGKAAVTSSGDVLPCVFARSQVAGNVKQQGFAKIVQGDKMLEFWGLNKDKVYVCKDCEFRYVCEDCTPWSYGFTGNLYSKLPTCTYDPYTGEWGKATEAFVQKKENKPLRKESS